MRLQNKVLLAIVPFIVVPMIIVGLLAYQHLYQTAVNSASDQIGSLVMQVDNRIADHIDRAERNLTLISNNSLMLDYIAADDAKRYGLLYRPVSAWLDNFRDNFPEYLAIKLLLPDGSEELLSSRSDDPVLSDTMEQALVTGIQQRQRTHTANNESTVSVLDAQTLNAPPRIVSLRPLYTRDDVPAGYLLLVQDAGFLSTLTNRDLTGADPRLFVSNAEGDIFAASTGGDQDVARKVIRSFIRHDNLDALKTINLNGLPYLAMVHRINDFIYLSALMPEAKLVAAATRLGRLVLLMTLGIVLLTGITLFIVMSLLVTRPLTKLNQLTKSIAEGNLDVVIDIDQQDEVGDLANSFSEMRTSLKESTRQIEELAYYDTLTGLPNKITFLEGLQTATDQAQQHGRQLGVLYFDLDNFKNVNDGLGHQMGDLLLMQVANRLRDCIATATPDAAHDHDQPQHLAARLGGDEFSMLVTSVHAPEDVSKMAVRILTKLSMPFNLNDHEVFVGASIGIAIYPHDGDTSEVLLKHADIAMYEAKGRGKNNFQFFDHTMNAPVSERLSLESKMRAALDSDEFRLYYQPRVPVNGQRGYEFEALIRWINPERGFISPGVFIPIAEESGLIQHIGEWVLEQACQQIRTWLDMGYEDVLISINLSPVQFNYGNPANSVRNALKKYHVEARHLEVEITESGLMQNESIATSIMLALKELGVRIALDDFGTGYSSLAYLRRFPIDTLKIDRSFINDLEQDPESILVLESIISLAQSLSLEIVAEGVETEQQVDLLRQRGCHIIQGFFFAKPSPPNDAMLFFDTYYQQASRLSSTRQ